MPGLCSICSNISFLDLPPFPPWIGWYHVPLHHLSELVPFVPRDEEDHDALKSGTRKAVSPGSLGLPYHQSLEALQEAAKTCDVCSLVEESVLRVKGLVEGAFKDARFAYYDKSGGPKYEFGITKRRDGEDGLLVWSMAKDNDECYLMGAIGYCVDDGTLNEQFTIMECPRKPDYIPENPLKNHFRGRPVLEDPADPVSLARLRRWLTDCSSKHSKCNLQTAPLPLRLLDIADSSLPSSQIRLVEPPPGTEGHYASLSHCWGHSPQFTTTRSTLEARKTGIDLSHLPKTFQDAVIVIRELGLRYIWIDSLCICQDDNADWERESAKMASTYAGAHITVAASRAASDITGFLTPRVARRHVVLPVTLKQGNDTIRGEIQLFNIHLAHAAGGLNYVLQEKETLSTRAWALQERYLAPRTLHFGEGQTSYECQECFKTEDGYLDTSKYFDIARKTERQDDEEKSRYHRMATEWYEMVFQYSRRNMSRESDKLPAMSGLARLWQQLLGEEYVAGLWKGDLIEGIAFQCFGGTHRRPEQWRAPSWSWASVDGILSVTHLGGWTDLAVVKDVRVNVKGENPYGEVSDAVLDIECILERAWVSKDKEQDEDKIPHTRHMLNPTEKRSKRGRPTYFRWR
ncbi:HET-domain-containing protein [Rhizodiscina lignyota]|uniref:HET-domain-containing protein n=1 Tax=Rhizodiscina lignyota TaxID=1504668 RepID=A0A9P4IL46_9PEZI|nr:HET-domain-containing protein [Rhizodiscina lignyota]